MQRTDYNALNEGRTEKKINHTPLWKDRVELNCQRWSNTILVLNTHIKRNFS